MKLHKELEISIAIIGNGNIAKRHVSNLRSLNSKFHLYLTPARDISDDLESRCDLEYISFKELIKKDLDYVIIASPATMHLQHLSLFVERKIPILIEKPIAGSISQVDEFLGNKSMDSIRSELYIAYCLRFDDCLIQFKKVIDQNIIGNILNIDIHVGQYLPDWRPSTDYTSSVSANADLGGGVLLELSHEIDYLHWIFGIPKVLWAKQRNSSLFEGDVEHISNIVMELEQSNALIFMHLDFVRKKPVRKCVILGEEGVITCDLLSRQITISDQESSRVIYDGEQDQNLKYLKMLTHFLNQDHHHFTNLHDSIEVLKTIKAIKAF